MSFMSKNPISSPKISEPPEVPHPGTRGLFPMADGWYDIDDEGNVKKLSGDSAGAQLSSDWSQNDDTAPDYVKNRTHYESKVLMAEFINAQPWENKILLEPIDLNNKYVININGADVETTVDGTNEDSRFNYDGQPVFQVLCNETSNEINVYPEFEGQNVSLYKISVKPLDEKYIPDSVARTAEIGDINAALEEIIELQEELMTPDGDEVSY